MNTIRLRNESCTIRARDDCMKNLYVRSCVVSEAGDDVTGVEHHDDVVGHDATTIVRRDRASGRRQTRAASDADASPSRTGTAGGRGRVVGRRRGRRCDRAPGRRRTRRSAAASSVSLSNGCCRRTGSDAGRRRRQTTRSGLPLERALQADRVGSGGRRCDRGRAPDDVEHDAQQQHLAPPS